MHNQLQIPPQTRNHLGPASSVAEKIVAKDSPTIVGLIFILKLLK
jgi:hypothetical protein